MTKQLVNEKYYSDDRVVITTHNFPDNINFTTKEYEEIKQYRQDYILIQYWVWIPNPDDHLKKKGVNATTMESCKDREKRIAKELKKKLVQEKKERMLRYQEYYEGIFDKYKSKKDQEHAPGLVATEQEIASATKLSEVLNRNIKNKNKAAQVIGSVCFSEISLGKSTELKMLKNGEFVKL